MPPETWTALAAGLLGFSGIAITAMIKTPWKKNGSSTRRSADGIGVSDGDCGDRRKAVKEILKAELEVVDVKLQNVTEDVGEMKLDIREIKGQTTQILVKLGD